MEVHWRDFMPLAGDGYTGQLPIERARRRLEELMRNNPVSGVRSPPGSGKTMLLPELLRNWSKNSDGAVVIVLPTQDAAQKIK